MIERGAIVVDPDGNEWMVKDVLPGDHGAILSRMVEMRMHAPLDWIGPRGRKYRPKETTA